MGLIIMMTPRTQPHPKLRPGRIIDFLYLGPGKGERLRELAQGQGIPDPAKRGRVASRYLVGIDTEACPADLAKMSNVDWVQGKAEEELPQIPDKSVKVVNSDFFVPHFMDAEQLRVTAQCLPEIQRVLVDNGKFYASIRRDNAKAAKAVLKQMGFDVRRRFPKQGEFKTEAMMRYAAAGPKYGFYQIFPVRVAATKKSG